MRTRKRTRNEPMIIEKLKKNAEDFTAGVNLTCGDSIAHGGQVWRVLKVSDSAIRIGNAVENKDIAWTDPYSLNTCVDDSSSDNGKKEDGNKDPRDWDRCDKYGRPPPKGFPMSVDTRKKIAPHTLAETTSSLPKVDDDKPSEDGTTPPHEPVDCNDDGVSSPDGSPSSEAGSSGNLADSNQLSAKTTRPLPEVDDDKLPEHLPTPRHGPDDSRQVLTENEALDCNPTSGESPGVEQTLLEEYMINETTYESLGVPFDKGTFMSLSSIIDGRCGEALVKAGSHMRIQHVKELKLNSDNFNMRNNKWNGYLRNHLSIHKGELTARFSPGNIYAADQSKVTSQTSSLVRGSIYEIQGWNFQSGSGFLAVMHGLIEGDDKTPRPGNILSTPIYLVSIIPVIKSTWSYAGLFCLGSSSRCFVRQALSEHDLSLKLGVKLGSGMKSIVELLKSKHDDEELVKFIDRVEFNQDNTLKVTRKEPFPNRTPLIEVLDSPCPVEDHGFPELPRIKKTDGKNLRGRPRAKRKNCALVPYEPVVPHLVDTSKAASEPPEVHNFQDLNWKSKQVSKPTSWNSQLSSYGNVSIVDMHRLCEENAKQRQLERSEEYIMRSVEEAAKKGDHKTIQALAAFSNKNTEFPRDTGPGPIEKREISNDTKPESGISKARSQYHSAFQDAATASPDSKDFMEKRAQLKKDALVAAFEASLTHETKT